MDNVLYSHYFGFKYKLSLQSRDSNLRRLAYAGSLGRLNHHGGGGGGRSSLAAAARAAAARAAAAAAGTTNSGGALQTSNPALRTAV